MDCKEVQGLIHGYLDSELDLVRSLGIEQHLQGCPACARSFNNHQVLRSSIKSGPFYFKPPVHLQKRIRSAVRKAERAEAKSPLFSWRWAALGTSLAVVAALLVFLLPALTGPSAGDLLPQELVSAHVRSLMADHLTDVASSDQHTVKPWFTGKLDFSPPVVDLTDSGFALVGGRLDFVANRSVAALVYQRRQHFINLFIWPSQTDSDVAENTLSRQGYNVIRWARSGMTYWAVSDVNISELQTFVQLVQDQTLP